MEYCGYGFDYDFFCVEDIVYYYVKGLVVDLYDNDEIVVCIDCIFNVFVFIDV